MPSDALVTVAGFSIIDFAFDVTRVALTAFDIVTRGALDAECDGLVILRTEANFLDTDFGFGQNVPIRTCETETSLRVEGFALVRSVVGLTVSVVVDEISRCALDAIAEIWRQLSAVGIKFIGIVAHVYQTVSAFKIIPFIAA
jgi:hypothetical protein